MLIVVATATWWLLVGKSVALPTSVGGSSSSSIAPVVIDSAFGSSSTDNATFSSLSKDKSISAFVGSTNRTAVDSESTYYPVKTRLDYSSATAPTPSLSSRTTPPNPVDAAKAGPATGGSTASGSTSSSGPAKPTAAPDYALSFAELLSAITAEFVFNVAGDHVLFPVEEDRDADQRLHTTAVVVAELLQRLHLTAPVYRLLNASTCAVAADMKRIRGRGVNPVAEVMRLTAEAAARDPQLRDELAAVRQRLANQIHSLPAQHGKFASTRSQTLYDVTGEQLAYAERLMEDVRVKRLVMSVTFFRASQFEEASVPEWVRGQASLARATFELARRPRWRHEVQRAFDEAVAESAEKFDAMAGDDELIFQTLRRKLEKNAPLNAELGKMGGRFAQTDT